MWDLVIMDDTGDVSAPATYDELDLVATEIFTWLSIGAIAFTVNGDIVDVFQSTSEIGVYTDILLNGLVIGTEFESAKA